MINSYRISRQLLISRTIATPAPSSVLYTRLIPDNCQQLREFSAVKKSSSAKNKAPLSQYGGVHGSRAGTKMWRNKPLFRREGDVRFRTGAEAAKMLVDEAKRRDGHEIEFIQSFTNTMQVLGPVFERMPKYAFLAKEFLSPERVIQFRVSWLDDAGANRTNVGWRVQYSSTLGPYEGGLHYHRSMSMACLKSMALSRTFTNAIACGNVGGAMGGADFFPHNKSEAEIQRFSQAYMTELCKYIGHDQDLPGVGIGVGPREIGYLYGQYKRSSPHFSQNGAGVLWGGVYNYPQVAAWGAVYFAKKMLEDKKDSIKGKRCIVTGSGKMALHVAEKLNELGAIPLTLSDSSGHIYEPEGIDSSKLRTIMKIKSERGARIGRYIIASTTAKFNEPERIFDIPCDLVFPCSLTNEIDRDIATHLADNGCMGVIECAHMPSTNEAIIEYRKRGMLHGSYIATLAADSFFNGMELYRNPLKEESVESRIEAGMDQIYEEAKATAKEFNVKGDLHSGALIAGFLRVADVQIAHGFNY